MKAGRALATLACLIAAPAGALCYTHVSGVIEDDSSALTPGAMVTVIDEDSGFRRATQSGPDGGYVVPSLQPGIYKITVRKPGFRTVIRFGVKVATRPVRVDFKLVVGSIQETVTVQGVDPLLNSDDASVGALVDRDQIERLPANGGGLLTLLELAPAVVVTPATRGEAGQFTVGGQRPNMNYFTVDGVSANTGVGGGGLPAQSNVGALPGMTAFGSLDSLISHDAVLEMRVQTSTTVPKFGRLPGGQISLTSRSGSNEWHGSMSFGLRNEALDANDWLANRIGDSRAPLRMQDFGGTAGGPMWRNRTFIFSSYEGMRLAAPLVWTQPSPSAASRAAAEDWAQPALNLFPVPKGPAFSNGLAQWTGEVSRPARLDSGSVRLDQAITSRLTGFARYSDSASGAQFGYDPVNFLDLRAKSITGGINLRARPDLVFDFRLNGSTASEDSLWQPNGSTVPADCYLDSVIARFFVPAPSCDYLTRLSIIGVGQVVAGSEGRRNQSQFQVTHTASWNRGSHAVQFGADYVRLTPRRNDASGSLSIITNSLADLTDGNRLWTAISPAQQATAVVQELSLFAEDTWRLTRRLTVTYGVRWELSPAPDQRGTANFLDLATGAPTPLERPLWQSSYDNIAPRIGLAYRLTNGGRTVIRAGGGFYLDSNLSLATDLINNGPLSFSQFVSPIHGIFSTILEFGFAPDLRLPLVRQWNVSVERGFSNNDVVSVGYVGSSGRSLIRREVGPGSVDTEWLALATNQGSSDYHSLQAQYRRRLSRGLQALASYAWSHSIDNSSTDAGIYWAGSGLTVGGDRASSDFDVRQALTVGFTYETPSASRSRVWRGWAFDGMFHARTGFPITALDAEQFTGISFENVFRPDFNGQPVWIVDLSAPGGRRINSLAFAQAPGVTQGTLGRNALSGFGMTQLDLALRREFSFHEQRSLQLRIEAYNALNHANFADPVRFLASPLFGQSSSMLNAMLGTGSPGSGLAPMFQTGGPRTLQVGLRFRF